MRPSISFVGRFFWNPALDKEERSFSVDLGRGFRRFRAIGWGLVVLGILGAVAIAVYAVFYERWDIQDDNGSWNGVIPGGCWAIVLIIFGIFLIRGERVLEIKDRSGQ